MRSVNLFIYFWKEKNEKEFVYLGPPLFHLYHLLRLKYLFWIPITQHFYFWQKVKGKGKIYRCSPVSYSNVSLIFVTLFVYSYLGLSFVMKGSLYFLFLLTKRAKFWLKDATFNCLFIKMLSVKSQIQILLIWGWIAKRWVYSFV